MVKIGAVLAGLAVAVAIPAPAGASGVLTQPDCAGVTVTASVFKQGGIPLVDWRENLEFDGRGTMWVSHVADNQVEGYGPDGTLRATVPVPGPGGIRRGPDGAMYVNFGSGPLSRDAGIMRFDPARPAEPPRAVVGGLHGINGLAIDETGNFYVSGELAPAIVKIRPDGTQDTTWSRAATVPGTNGLAIADGQLYATATTDLLSPVERVPLADPAAHARVANLSVFPTLYKGLDDLTVVGDHLVIAAFVAGELLRVDRTTGAACVLARGLHAPTSVRAPVGFGAHDPATELFVTEASGRIMRITAGMGACCT